jgi:hypothetical protein
MSTSTIDEWATQQWGSVELGDKRRTHRAVHLGAQMAADPGAGLPGQTQSWGDLKAAYRLLHEDDVTHYALSLPHWQHTRQRAEHIDGPVLFIQDGSQLDFTLRQAQGLGRIGDDKGQGLLIHTTLAVQPGTPPAILGLAHQLVWVREDEPRKGRETRTQRTRRSKESDHWFGALDAIGPVPANACWVSVGDRESDIFQYWQRAKARGWECLLRLVQDRRILRDDDSLDHLQSCVAHLMPQAHQVMSLRSRPDQPARTAKLSLAWTSMRILPPRNDPTLCHEPPLTVWVLRVWEEAAPADVKPLEWLLLSTLPIEDAEQARERALWYRHRWLIEQYHKALKTGCRMESSQLRQGAALMRLLGLLSIVAVRLLQVESLARLVPDLPAARVVDRQMLDFVCHLRHLDPATMTVYQFWREVARYGGFLGRKGDGEPGWQTLWRGWQYLYPRFEGYLLGKQCG